MPLVFKTACKKKNEKIGKFFRWPRQNGTLFSIWWRNPRQINGNGRSGDRSQAPIVVVLFPKIAVGTATPASISERHGIFACSIPSAREC